MASDSRPTEPVTYQASVLSAMVTTATQTDVQSRLRGVSQGCVAANGVLDGAMDQSVTNRALTLLPFTRPQLSRWVAWAAMARSTAT